MTPAEYGLFRQVKHWAQAQTERLHVFPQVAIAELLKCPQTEDQEAFWSFGCKRTDLVVTDQSGHAVIAVEYQGRQHFAGNATERDQIKRLAFERAGVQWLQVFSDDTVEDRAKKLDAAWAAYAVLAAAPAAANTVEIITLDRTSA